MSSKVGFRLDETILLLLFEKKKNLREYPKALKLVFTPRPLFFEKKKAPAGRPQGAKACKFSSFGYEILSIFFKNEFLVRVWHL